ncbi:MAG: hypothetical protein KKF27_20520 [Gammaproteobacteria bacterium]|nr:hypothetical protein [Gammaproteobacteria bacterium]
MEQDKQIALGLNTDLPPNRIGDQALRAVNVVPASAISMKPRPGTSKTASYHTVTLGRKLVLDDLPQRTDGKYLVVAVNTTASDTSATEGLAVYVAKHLRRPTAAATTITEPGTVWDDTWEDVFVANTNALHGVVM